MVHLRVADEPVVKPVIADVGDEEVVIIAVPDTNDQLPVPDVGSFPAKVVLVTLHRD
jgi:hypothetical protein